MSCRSLRMALMTSLPLGFNTSSAANIGVHAGVVSIMASQSSGGLSVVDPTQSAPRPSANVPSKNVNFARRK